MMLWLIFGLLLLMAIGFLAVPMYRQTRSLSALLAATIVFVVGLSALMYQQIGSPNVPSGAAALPNVEEMVEGLAKRLKDDPDDLNGWRMLAQSHQVLKQYPEAIAAWERVIDLEQSGNAQSLTALAGTLMERDGGAISQRAAGLLENALVVDASDPQALFYGGIAAATRGDTDVAAERWERLLVVGGTPPPEVQELIQQRIAEWRGTPLERAGTIVTASLISSSEVDAPADATVFIIARDPAQPSPPIAVTRRKFGELPTVVEMSDADSMVPGRSLSMFPTVELIARVSLSGQAAAQPGDWYGSQTIESDSGSSVELVIDRRVEAD